MSALCARFLEGFGDTILDVPTNDDDAEDEDESEGPHEESRKDQ